MPDLISVPKLFTVIYPENNSKVTNPNVIFKWTKQTNANEYRFTLYEGITRKYPRKITITWRKVFSGNILGCSYGRRLNQGKPYLCFVVPLYLLRPSPNIPKDITPKTVRVDLVTNVASDPIPEEIYQLPKALRPATSLFYVKEYENYLANYLELKSANLKQDQRYKPIVPLLFFQLERYCNGEMSSDSRLDQAFLEAIERAPEEFRNKIGKMVTYYKQVPDSIKIKFSGQSLHRLPADRFDLPWAEEAVMELFGKSPTLMPLLIAMHEQKRMDLEFKYPIVSFTNVILRDGQFTLSLNKVQHDRFSPQYQLNLDRQFFLRIFSLTNQLLAEIPVSITEDANNYLITPMEPERSNFDSAAFGIELWDMDPNSEALQKRWDTGTLIVSGGTPKIFLVNPPTLKQSDTNTQVRVYIRDAGTSSDRHLILRGTGGNPDYTIPAVASLRNLPSEQSLYFQVFEFKLQDYGPTYVNQGKYRLAFKSDREYNSQVEFYVESATFQVRLKELKCVDESNPEWWGDDTVFFQTIAGTKYFLQEPLESSKYKHYHDGKSRYEPPQTPSLKREDTIIYSLAGPRQIEEFLSIGISLYEYDNLDFIKWLVDAILDFIQSYLLGLICELINCIVPGLGVILNIALEIGFEEAGLNDIREQAVNSMISSCEIELLSTNALVIPPPTAPTTQKELMLTGKDSKYKMYFEINAIQ
jgi:hypothetical protein